VKTPSRRVGVEARGTLAPAGDRTCGGGGAAERRNGPWPCTASTRQAAVPVTGRTETRPSCC
jgi:hypothetical protein